MPLNLDAKELEAWKVMVKEEQNRIGDLLGRAEWQKTDKNCLHKLRQKISFGIFGFPHTVSHTEDNLTGYTEFQLSCTDKVVEFIVQKHEQSSSKYIYMAFIYVLVKLKQGESIVPVIRVPTFRNGCMISHFYIDTDWRSYKDWNDYVKNNKLPECVMCYPCNGVYTFEHDGVHVGFTESPACSILNKVVTGCDIANITASVGTAGVLVAGVFLPLSIPLSIGSAVAVALTGAYSTGRSIGTLVDRSRHGQSIGLQDAESRNSWLGIAGSSLGIASSGVAVTNCRILQAGKSLGTVSQIGLRSVALGSCAIGALGITNGIANIVQKRAVGKEDILHLCTSVLFFTNAVITTYQANLLISSLQQSRSNNSYSAILASISEFTGGNSSAIDTESLISIIQQHASPALLSLGIVGPNCACFIDMCLFAFNRLFTVTVHYLRGAISLIEYIAQLTHTLKQLWERFEREIMEVVPVALRHFNVPSLKHVTMNGRQIFHGDVDMQQERNVGIFITSSVVDYKSKISGSIQAATLNSGDGEEQDLNKTAVDYIERTMKVLETVAEHSKCENSVQFSRCTKVVTDFLEHELNELIRNYEQSYAVTAKFSNVGREEFDKAYGIMGNRIEWFSKQVFTEFDNGATRYRLLNDLCQLLNTSQPAECSDLKKLLSRPGHGSFYLFTSMREVSHDELISVLERVEQWSICRGLVEISDDDSVTVIICKDALHNKLGTVILKKVSENNGFVAVIPHQQ